MSVGIACVSAEIRTEDLKNINLEQRFSNGAPQKVAKCAANIKEVYFKNEKNPFFIEIFIHSLKYINIFLISYKKCARKLLYVLQCAANQKCLRTTGLVRYR
jgi:hypothetical protein